MSTNWNEVGATCGARATWNQRKAEMALRTAHDAAWEQFYEGFKEVRRSAEGDRLTSDDEVEARVEFGIMWDRENQTVKEVLARVLRRLNEEGPVIQRSP